MALSRTDSYNISYRDELKFKYWNVVNNEVVPETKYLSPKVFRKIDYFFDLGTTKDVLLDDLTRFELTQFYFVMRRLSDKGITCALSYNNNGKIETHYLLKELSVGKEEEDNL